MEREERRRGKRNPPKLNPKSKGRKKGQDRGEVKKLPSERYPNLEVRENIIKEDNEPNCPCCNEKMKESGLFDTSEKLEVQPKLYYIVRNKKVKYNCGRCYGAMVNTPSPKSIIPSSNYGDSLIIDVALSKYCDLIPIERFASIAFRDGLINLPPQSLIGLTHHLANYLDPVYQKLRELIMKSLFLRADETPHRMLEGDRTKNWYLWGFFTNQACFFEAHNTRSGDIAKNFLLESSATHLLTDAFPGYSRAIKEIFKENKRKIIEVFCNSHAFRYFKDAGTTWKEEVEFFLSSYDKIYKIEAQKKEEICRSKQKQLRLSMLPLFEKMKKKCEEIKKNCMPKSGLELAVNYFLNQYEGLTVCTRIIDIDLDNNHSERVLRSPVIGRKTWLGTHSKRGAKTNAVLFSIVQSCFINGVNPRNYFPWVVQQIQLGKDLLTPYEYLQIMETQ